MIINFELTLGYLKSNRDSDRRTIPERRVQGVNADSRGQTHEALQREHVWQRYDMIWGLKSAGGLYIFGIQGGCNFAVCYFFRGGGLRSSKKNRLRRAVWYI